MTTETHGMKFLVDASGVAKGFREYEAAVDGIFKKLDQFEAHVQKTMKGVASAANNKSALGSFKKSIEAFGNVNIDPNAAKRISALSAALGGFKAPSASQAANTRSFFKSLGNLPDLSAAYRSMKNIASLRDGLAGFAAPTSAMSKRLRDFAAAMQVAQPALMNLRSVAGISGIANELASISIALQNLKVPSKGQITNLGNFALALRQFNFGNLSGASTLAGMLGSLGSFKAPSPAQVKNLQNFINALGTLKVPANTAAIATSMNQIAAAAAHANGALGGFRANIGGMTGGFNTFNRGARQASINMMGLQNAFSGTFQIGSALRSLLGSLTIAELARSFLKASNAALQFKAQMGVIAKETGFADLQLKYINETANKFGIDILQAEQGFAKVSIAASKSGMSVMQTREVFEGFSTAMAVLGTSTERQGDVWLAVQQIMNKGYLSAEELNQQLNEQLPGAMAYATEAAKKLGMSLQDALKKKALEASDVLQYISKRFKEDFGPSLAAALERPQAQFTRLTNNVQMLFQAIGENGASAGLGRLLGTLAGSLDPSKVEEFAKTIGEALSDAFDKAGQAINWFKANWESLKGPISTALDLLGKWMLISGALQIGRALITPLLTLRMSLLGVGTTMAGLTGQTGALGIGFARLTAGVMPLNAGLAGLGRVGVMAAGSFTLLSSTSRVTAVSLIALNGAANIARVGMNALAMGARGVMALLGGPWGIALMAATYLIYEFYNAWSTASEALANTQPIIDGTNEMLVNLGLKSLTSASNTKELAAQHEAAKKPINEFAGEVGAAAQALWDMAAAQKAANIQQLVGRIQSMRENRTNALGGEGFGGDLYRGWQVIRHGGVGAAHDAMAPSIAPLDTSIAEAETQLAAYRKRDLREEVTPGMRAVVRPGAGGGNPLGGGSGHKRKGKSAHDLLVELQNDVDGVMGKLMDGNEIWKIWQESIRDVTKEAEVLLNPAAYKRFTDGLSAGMEKGKTASQQLIEALQTPGAIAPKALADLEKRYGMSVSKVIDLLKAQEAEFSEKTKDAIIKQLDTTFRSADRAFRALAESNPFFKAQDERYGGLVSMARAFLDKDQLEKWYQDLASGNTDAQGAFADLLATIKDAEHPTEALTAMMAKYGLTTDDVVDSMERMNRASEYHIRLAKQDMGLGTTYLRNLRETGDMLRLTTDQAELYTEVQTEVKAALDRGDLVTKELIDDLLKQAAAQKLVNKQLQLNRDFFENNGVRTYIKDVQDAGTAINELDNNFLKGLEDSLVEFGKTGKLSFASLFDTIQEGILRFSAQNVIKTLMTNVFGQDQMDGGTPSIFGGVFKALGLGTYEPKKVDNLGTMMNPMYVKFATGASINSLTGNINERNGRVIVGDGTTSDATDSPWYAGVTGDTGMADVFGGSNGGGSGPTNLLDGAGWATSSTTASTAATDTLVQNTTTKVAGSFQQSMGAVLPLIGMSFASSFKSPIAQIGGMFLTMMLSKMLTAQAGSGGGGGGIGGLFSSIGGLFGGGGGGLTQALPTALSGIYKEGGLVGSAVGHTAMSMAAFAGAPHFAEGTHNTSGIPAVLHDNEAVIPLSRGRKVPVEMAGGGGKGVTVVQNYNITTPNPDGFRQSKQQIAADMHVQATRAFRRNH